MALFEVFALSTPGAWKPVTAATFRMPLPVKNFTVDGIWLMAPVTVTVPVPLTSFTPLKQAAEPHVAAVVEVEV